MRDDARATEVIESVIARAEEPNPAYLDTLAASRAERGDFEGARRAASEALALLESMHVPEEVSIEVRGHLETFARHEPLRDP